MTSTSELVLRASGFTRACWVSGASIRLSRARCDNSGLSDRLGEGKSGSFPLHFRGMADRGSKSIGKHMAILSLDLLSRADRNATKSGASISGCRMPKTSVSLARRPLDVSVIADLDAKKEREPRKTVLCIEDDQDTAELICEELENRGFSVIVANNGQEGWSLLLKSHPDIILSDINMPFMSGFEILEGLKTIAPRFAHVPFICLTALNDRDDELKGRLLGADDYVAKPIDFNLLHAIINARIKSVARMNVWPTQNCLNDREIDALMWVARGKTSEEISLIMSISERTVNFHLNNARDKLGVVTRIQAAVKATVAQFIEP